MTCSFICSFIQLFILHAGPSVLLHSHPGHRVRNIRSTGSFPSSPCQSSVGGRVTLEEGHMQRPKTTWARLALRCCLFSCSTVRHSPPRLLKRPDTAGSSHSLPSHLRLLSPYSCGLVFLKGLRNDQQSLQKLHVLFHVLFLRQ